MSVMTPWDCDLVGGFWKSPLMEAEVVHFRFRSQRQTTQGHLQKRSGDSLSEFALRLMQLRKCGLPMN